MISEIGGVRLKKVLGEFFDLLSEVFFSLGLVVDHEDGDVLFLHVLDESVLVVVKKDLFHRFPAKQVIVSTLSAGCTVPGDISGPADIETDLDIDGDRMFKDAPVETLECSDVAGT